MKVGIDAHMVGHSEGGNETYIYNLVNALAEIDRQNKYVIFVTDNNVARNWRINNPNFIFDTVFSLNLFRLGFQFLGKVKKHQLDLMHFTYHLPLLCPCKIVLTIHDIGFMKFPYFLSRKNKYLMPIIGKWSAQKSNAIITISDNSKKDIQRFYHITEKMIHIAHGACSEKFFNIEKTNLSKVKAKYRIGRDYVLFLGNIEPRKNLMILIRGFSKIINQYSLDDYDLVIGGKPWRLESKLLEEIQKLGINDHVVFIGRVEDSDLPSIYALAKLFVFPSIYEGFGLPPLEAMACGIPVITSNTSSLPEVVSDAGILVDPYDVEGWASAIYNVLTNHKLRKKMITKGLERTKSFSWEYTARKTLNVYKEVYSNG